MENYRPKELRPLEKKNIIKQLLLEEYSQHLDQLSVEAVERLIANIVEQTVTGLAEGESTTVVLGKVRQHPTSFDYILRDVDDEFIANMIDSVKLLWAVPDELLMP